MTDGGVAQRTLELFAETPRLNRWLYGKLGPYVRGDVLEIGSGIGTLSRLLVADLADGRRAVLSDTEPAYLRALSGAFAGDERIEIARYDLEGAPPPSIATRRFDTIVAVNVIEHVANDGAMVATLAERLAPGGRLLLYVPACPFAFCGLDRAVGHHRRYTDSTLGSLLREAGLVVEALRYVNLLGLLGWLVSGKVLRRKIVGGWSLALFERLMPIVRLEDRVRLPLGLGLWAVARVA
jgi:SAM-dependent methyltransferase